MSFEEWQMTELKFVLQSGLFLIVDGPANVGTIGFVQMNRLSDSDGWAYYREFFPGDLVRSWQALEATGLFLDYLFHRYPIRKLYAEFLAFQETPLRKLQFAGFEEEMRLKDDTWYGDSYVDYVFLGLFREEWLQRRGEYLGQIAVEDAMQHQERAPQEVSPPPLQV
ncbi:MAG: hypothetical protein A2Y61_07240 [Chloroflexi bacterium RBG_13_60_13]|nr:MAG: hypothetical protein A2Y61_07240 [Chloroflexi bacterium RBG_13_60_13]